MRRVPHVLLCFALLFVLGRGSAPAQTAASTAGPVRYHFGDDPNGAKGWANPNTDDSSWPVAQQGRWPEPVFDSDGFVWVRMLVPVRSDTAEPLALRIVDLSRAWMANEVFVNGVRVGSFGRLPPIYSSPVSRWTPSSISLLASPIPEPSPTSLSASGIRHLPGCPAGVRQTSPSAQRRLPRDRPPSRP